jgi:hypothetical protein
MTDREQYTPGPASDVLGRFLAGQPIGRIVGAEVMKFGGWQRLNAEYARQFGIETPKWPPKSGSKFVNRRWIATS